MKDNGQLQGKAIASVPLCMLDLSAVSLTTKLCVFGVGGWRGWNLTLGYLKGFYSFFSHKDNHNGRLTYKSNGRDA